MNKKISLGITISLVAIGCAITFIIATTFSLDLFNSKVQNVKEREELYSKLSELDLLIRNNFSGTIEDETIMNSILDGYVAGLSDKYARYYTPEEFQKSAQSDGGYNVGIGVTVSKEESGYIKVVGIASNGPAAAAGIQVGDHIVEVGGVDVLTAGYETSVNSIAGTENTNVTITIRRDGEDTEYTLMRKKFEIISVTQNIYDKVGYIKITEFNELTSNQFKKALNELIDKGVEGFVFDVRNNPGGLVTATGDVIDLLVGEGDIAVSVDKNGTESVIVKSDSNKVDLPMAVLINGKSASGAELFAASLRDFNNASLVGVNSYGKGVMQNTYKLSDGSAVAFTVGHYKTTKSDNYDGVGLKPTYDVVLPTDIESQFPNIDLESDTQLKKALEVVNASIK